MSTSDIGCHPGIATRACPNFVPLNIFHIITHLEKYDISVAHQGK